MSARLAAGIFGGGPCRLRLGAVGLAAALMWAAQAEGVPRVAAVTLPLDVQVALENGAAVVDQTFLDAHLRWANEVFAVYGVQFALKSVSTFDGSARMETREDRDFLGTYVHEGVINCFVVASLRDVDDPRRIRRGVHWHSSIPTHAHYVILSAIAEPFVLAHELGHFLGNPRHSHTPGNLMSYTRRSGLPFLDAAQQARVQRRLRRYLREGELIPVTSSP